MKIIILNSHPIQYFAPLYQYLSKLDMTIEVWYCSMESIIGAEDKDFKTKIKWDIPLLDDYEYVFLKNYAIKPSIHNGFWGLVNLGVLKRILFADQSIIMVHGWGYFTHILTIVFGCICGHKVYLRAETPLNQELLQKKHKRFLKKILLSLLFKFVDAFLYIGTQNKQFYQYFGIEDKKLRFTPYAVDNDRFTRQADSFKKKELRTELNLPVNARIFLFSGKYSKKKRPLDILNAFLQVNMGPAYLILMGEGELRTEMEGFVRDHNLGVKVMLTGFVNQSRVSQYYAAADVFLMCSGGGETWGLSINEAMNFSMPIIVSDLTGSSLDLVKPGVNGFIFKTGDIQELATILKIFVEMDQENLEKMGSESKSIVSEYNFANIAKGLNANGEFF